MAVSPLFAFNEDFASCKVNSKKEITLRLKIGEIYDILQRHSPGMTGLEG